MVRTRAVRLCAADYLHAMEQEAGRQRDPGDRSQRVFLALWPLKRDSLPRCARAASRSVQLTADAVDALVRRTEGNLLACAQEIDKLALLANGRRIDERELEDLAADSARFDVFGMVEATFAGDGARARRMLASLRAEGEAPATRWPGCCRTAGRSEIVAAAARTAVRGIPQRRHLGCARCRVPQGWRAAMHDSGSSVPAEAARVDRLSKGRGVDDPFLALERLLLRISDARAGKRMVA